MKLKEEKGILITKFKVIQQSIFPGMEASMKAIEKQFKKSRAQKEKQKRRTL